MNAELTGPDLMHLFPQGANTFLVELEFTRALALDFAGVQRGRVGRAKHLWNGRLGNWRRA
jgi:hypothetical protein